MTVGIEARAYMDRRGELTGDELNFINTTFDDLYFNAQAWGVNAANDDRAADLEGALIKFVFESRRGK